MMIILLEFTDAKLQQKIGKYSFCPHLLKFQTAFYRHPITLSPIFSTDSYIIHSYTHQLIPYIL